uniref:Uncharacterized protein n=1 Tax=Fagus sylvatica TaxID=28930 RepID=A0A2N9IZA4_FAGSY
MGCSHAAGGRNCTARRQRHRLSHTAEPGVQGCTARSDARHVGTQAAATERRNQWYLSLCLSHAILIFEF